MTHHARFDHQEAVEGWLHQHQRALGRGLDEVLDLEAGLHEVLLQSRHDSLTDDLDTALHVESGLSSILPAEAHTLMPVQSAASQAPDSGKGTEGFLHSVSPQSRMRLRARHDVADACHVLTSIVELVHDLNSASLLATQLNRVRARSLVRAKMNALAVLLDRAFAHTDVLVTVRDYETPLGGDTRDVMRIDVLQQTLGLIHARVRDLVRSLNHSSDDASVRERANELATTLGALVPLARPLIDNCTENVRRVMGRALGQHLPMLDRNLVYKFLDDFTESDLSTADLVGIDLSGVQWSEHGTRWPPSIDIENLKARSEETTPGSRIYVVRSGTATARDCVGLA